MNEINEFSKFAEKLMVLLRDGRTLIGYLRSIDQFGTCDSAAFLFFNSILSFILTDEFI